MAEEKLKTGNHYVHIMYTQKEAKIKLALIKRFLKRIKCMVETRQTCLPELHHCCKQSEMQSILDSFEKKVGKKNKKWIWNRNRKHSIVLKQSFSKPE